MAWQSEIYTYDDDKNAFAHHAVHLFDGSGNLLRREILW